MKIQNKFKRLPLWLACHTLHLSFSVNSGKKYQKMGLKSSLLKMAIGNTKEVRTYTVNKISL